MIQFRRGTTKSWQDTKTKLASGQPGYDKDKHKIKIGDGETLWKDLPYASGISAKEVLDSEESAKSRSKQDDEDKTLITYGTDTPDNNTVGQLYLQQYDADPEADYVISSGIDGIWTYQKWKSGIAKCWGTIKLDTNIQDEIDGSGFFSAGSMKSEKYPFTFSSIPSEIATLQSPGWIVWLASKTENTAKSSGIYMLISNDEQPINTTYKISIHVEGFWK